MTRLCVTAVTILLGWPWFSHGQTTALLPQTAVRADALDTFVRGLQDAIDRDDRPAVAAMFYFPATMLAGGLGVPLRDTAAVLRYYRLAFPPELKAAIAVSGVVRQ